jgi:hypothetical protein
VVADELGDQSRNRRRRTWAFQLDVDEGTLVHGFEDLAQRWDAFARAGVELADLSKGLARQRATTISRSFETLIVKDDQFAIDELHVDLDARRAEFERPADGAQRILRLVTRGAAVANGHKSRGGSEGHRANQGAAAAGNVIVSTP